MKKSLILLVLALCGTMAFTSCDMLFAPTTSESTSSVSEVESEKSESDEENETSTSDEEDETSTSDEESSAPIEETVKVIFKQNGQVDKEFELEKGESFAEEDIPMPAEKIGYTVVWEDADLTDIQEDITVNAIETANTYTITYDAGNGMLEENTQDVVFDDEVTHPVPVLEDWEFIAWTYDGGAVEDGVWKIADNVTLVAQWEDKRPSYTVTFVQGTVSTPITVVKGEGVAKADIPALTNKIGYTVVWENVDLSNIQNDITVEAVETPNVYTVTYDADGFELDGATVSLTYDALCADLDMSLTKEDANFLGWKYNNVTYTNTSVWNVADNVTLTADWVAKDQVVVSFVDTDGSTINKFVYIGEDLTDIPVAKDKVGYSVDKTNWYEDEACTVVASFNGLQEAKTVYAKAIANTYVITYDANGGTLANTTQNVVYDAEYTLATPSREGYWSFGGWKDSQGNFVTDGVWKTDEDVTLTAQWNDTRQTFKVYFKQEYQEIISFDVMQGDDFTAIPDPVAKTGYTVVWEDVDLSNIQSNITVNAIETPKDYTITYNANGGTVSAVNLKVTYDAAYSLATPTRVGYKFNGWKYNGEAFANSGTWVIDADIELVADWTAKTYAVTIDADGGNCSATLTFTYNQAIGTLPTPTRDGYTFNGWTYNGVAITESTVWTNDVENVTIKATWTKNVTDEDQWTNNY